MRRLPRARTAALAWLALLALPIACDPKPGVAGAGQASAAASSSAVPHGSASAGGAERAASGSAAPGPAALPPLNVLLITVDALRADGPWLGYPRDSAPKISALAKQSVVYSHAYALSSYTSMSLAGLMSGRYPSELPRDGRATSSFLPEAEFLAERAQAAGVYTLGVHGHVYFLGATGINQGFDAWRVFPRIVLSPAREGAVVDPKLTDMLIDELSAHARQQETAKAKQRFFAWVHYMDPHFSYVRHADQQPFRGSPYAAGAAPVPPGVALSEVGQSLRNQYDGEVRHTDAQIGRLLDYIDAQPWAQQTAIVLTADHGEAFGEHKSYFEHGFLLYDVTTRVPLMFRVPGVAPRRVDARRSHLDLARTLLELMAVQPSKAMRGQSLLPEVRGLSAPQPRDVVIDMPYTDQSPRRRALIHGDKKLIVTETEKQPLLFDLKADPGEQHDLGADPSATAPLVKRMHELDQAAPDFAAPRISARQY